jgi:hypothetical protein
VHPAGTLFLGGAEDESVRGTIALTRDPPHETL